MLIISPPRGAGGTNGGASKAKEVGQLDKDKDKGMDQGKTDPRGDKGGGSPKRPRSRHGYLRSRKPKAGFKAAESKLAALGDEEGTPLTEEEYAKRPKGPIIPAKPVVIEMRPVSSAKAEKPAAPRKKDTPKPLDAPKEPKQVEEVRPEFMGIPLSDIPKEFPVNFNQRIGVFVDVQNMFYTAKHKYQRKIDFKKLIEAISRKRQIVRAMAYIIEAPEINQSQFKHVLAELGFELRIKDLRVRADGTAKGDWDMGIAIDTINLREKLDVVALVSGDGDFTDLVYMLKANGLRVEVYSFPSNTADDLKRAATFYHPLGEEVLMKW